MADVTPQPVRQSDQLELTVEERKAAEPIPPPTPVPAKPPSLPGTDPRVVNTVWGQLAAAALARLGVTHVVASPGSRSTPLTHAFAEQGGLIVTPVLDERSAAFYALGLARARGEPVGLVCTSGTAAAHYLPAVIEASESRVPLVILTADRPAELRFCRAGQTIDQVKLFGDYVRWYGEARDPEGGDASLRYWRNLLVHAVERSRYPVAGPVHINVPFREPLEPVPTNFNERRDALLKHVEPPARVHVQAEIPELNGSGIIIAGPAQPVDLPAYLQALKQIAEKTNWPVLSDTLNPARHHIETIPNVIAGYDLILRHAEGRNFVPQQVLQLGDLPTSKALRQWLQLHQLPTVVVDDGAVNADAAHARSQHCRCTIETFARDLPRNLRMDMGFTVRWMRADKQARAYLRDNLRGLGWLFEGTVARAVAEAVPDGTALYVASSTPVRDFEWFWPAGDRQRRIFFNRGANGIDGTLSTALGVAAGLEQPTILYTGDLALLHDTNGFLLGASKYFRSGLTIVCINNQGGGIFEHLAIAKQTDHFEELWGTPQVANLGALATAYGVSHERIDDLETLRKRLETLPKQGVRLLELCTDRKRDAAYRQKLFADFELPNEPNS
ncbi:MAG: 2-succinyl-5-enolpyruvyl-6-hydroxy-3-cyclohexene-1-carboxylic-acid synthase [Verrucomicrobiota bacterium JB022]|nr:2-succinyl-5-enolpyruvyl-6-hydroxy-3-cyclohexene-1-carboxylic-acid synthase [Verrucomicrobiota bacterium JB022]